MSRQFNQQQKQALYWLAGGKCENCGIELPENWHADHVKAYVTGGQTDVVNGQALCPTCNMKKGAGLMLKQWPQNITLRTWQQAFLDRHRALSKSDFLLVATPGAGKTIASLRLVHNLINDKTVERIVVVCPTDHLRTQWLEDASSVHIHLDKVQLNWQGSITHMTDYIGLVTTYAQVANKAEHLRAFCQRFKTLVLLDEIHHCGENDNEHLAWGDAIKKAFTPARARLLLSGTPFRSDNNPIPFVAYNRDPNNPSVKISEPDYNYGYGHALKDEGVVRQIVIPGWDGEFAWSDWYGEERTVSFQHLLNKSESSQRLRTAINADGQAIRTVLTKAAQKLDEVRRNGHTDAGGLVVAQDQNHAKQLAVVLQEVTGEKPVVVISELGDEASPAIKRFRDGTQKWIVAIKMVSEGVDIKRLRVGVYATNVTTETFFRQVIGRVIRWDNRYNELEDNQAAWFYVPEDPDLVERVRSIKEEVLHSIDEKQEADKKKSAEPGLPFQQLPMGEYEFVSSTGDEKHHYTDGETVGMDEMAYAESFFRPYSGFGGVASAFKALFLRANPVSGQSAPADMPAPESPPPPPLHQQKKTLQSTIKKRMGFFVSICQQNNLSLPEKPYAAIHTAWGRARKFSQDSTNDDLQSKLDWLDSLVDRAKRGDKTVLSEIRP